MNYHNIKKVDLLNGDGIRTVLFVSGCNHYCKGCQNMETWDYNSGILFDENAMNEIREEMKLDYVSGLTLSGGDPLFYKNLNKILEIVKEIKKDFPNKTIWIYTGYEYENLLTDDSEDGKLRREILKYCDTIVDGKFVKELADTTYPWAGSRNQRIINLKTNNR